MRPTMQQGQYSLRLGVGLCAFVPFLCLCSRCLAIFLGLLACRSLCLARLALCLFGVLSSLFGSHVVLRYWTDARAVPEQVVVLAKSSL